MNKSTGSTVQSMRAAMNIDSQRVIDLLYRNDGICLDNEYEVVYLAMRICQLFDLEFPEEWSAIVKQGRS